MNDEILPDGIAVINNEFKIIVFNEAASRITGYQEDFIIGKDCHILFSHAKNSQTKIKEAFSKNISFTNQPLSVTSFEGKIISVLASITPVVKDSEVINIVFVFRDTNEMLTMTELVKAKTMQLQDQKNRLDAIFNSNIEGTFTIDHDWNITAFNSSAEKITGYKQEEALGKKCWSIFNSPLCRNGCHMEQTMRKGKPAIGKELEIINKSGKTIPIRVNSGILKNNKGEKTGAVETFLDISEIINLSAHLRERFQYANIIGKNKELEKVFTLLESVAQTGSNVLITGESGTGKELIARAIHLNSSRKNNPFIAINCSAFVETLIESELFGHEKGAFTGAINSKPGRFEMANGGTLFLDEIGDISPAIQTKLLRVLETREFERVGGTAPIKTDFRMISATNKNLQDEIEQGNFRKDFFYRINVVNIHLPPLRERKDDLPLLLGHFIKLFNGKFGKSVNRFSPGAYNLFYKYDWPGNIRELENAIEHCFVLCKSSIIQEDDLPLRIRSYSVRDNTASSSFESAETEVITQALKKHKGNKSQTAKELGIDKSTLWRKMKKLGL